MTRTANRQPIVINIGDPDKPDSSLPVHELLVTIDGPAGTGKSTVARLLAQRLGVDFLDTGAMYRAATALALDAGVPTDDEAAIVKLLEHADLRFDWSADPPDLRASGKSIMHRLRDADVTALVSPVSALPKVREFLVKTQRRIGSEHPKLVSEGRDQGSVVFPEADVKIYLDASPRVRAERRASQLAEQGITSDVRAIETEINLRDKSDMSRAVGPLTCPEDAIRFDTSSIPQDEVVAELHKTVVAALKAKHHRSTEG